MRAAKSSTATTGEAELQLGLTRSDAALYVVGALVTAAFAYEASLHGPVASLGVLLALAFLAAATYAYAVHPALAVALTIPFFALLPAAKVLVNPNVGPAKDGIVLAAGLAAIATSLSRRRTEALTDRWLVTSVVLLLFLYAVNVAGRHGIAWFHGLRLAAEPLILLLVGMVLPEPRKTQRWAVRSLILTGCFVAIVGLLQQAVGPNELANIGFTFNEQIRTIQGHLRSFGTMDEPFAYASFLLLAFAAVVFGRRRTSAGSAAAVILLAGIAVSYVRTAVLILFAFLALELARQKRVVVAAALGGVLVVTAVILVAGSSGTQSRTWANPSGSAAITLNGRTSAWKAALGSPSDWPLGRGVGEVGTAAQRAGYKLTFKQGSQQQQSLAVDSGYFATIADVGIVGLVVLLALFGRAAYLARGYALRGSQEAWFALAVIAAVMIDALTRSSFIAFPSAFLEMLMIGIALNAARAAVTAKRR
jgi:O-antigen ligase/polysaccharide polymerase Wzy-like membrane protein